MTTRHRFRWLLPLLAAGAVASCSTSDLGRPAPGTAPRPDDATAQAALAAYEEFWTVTDAAFAAPGAKEWTPRAEEVATGQALESLRRDIANYASIPAHSEGTVVRAPRVAGTSPGRVGIVDCIDIGRSRLVSDTDGQVLDDLANRVPRYLYRAELVPRGGRWVVDRTAPSLAEPC